MSMVDNIQQENVIPFAPLAGVSTTAAISSTDQLKNIKENIKLNLPRLHNLPEFYKVKGFEVPIALVGGGSDLKNQLDELRKFKTIFACGSVHDYLINNNIIPTYAAICDPDSIGLNYYQIPHTEVKYLIASGCDPTIFKHLQNYQIVMWHCHSDDFKPEEIEEKYEAVGGGCTIGLRSISIAIMLGYSNIHLFGFDSCLSNTEHGYAYPLSSQIEKNNQGAVYRIRKGLQSEGVPREKDYYCLGYHLAQVDHFKMFYSTYYEYFTPTFHGAGLLPDFMRMIQEDLKVKLSKLKEAV